MLDHPSAHPCRVPLLAALAVCMLTTIAHASAQPPDALRELTAVRDALRERLRERARADTAGRQPFDLAIEVDRGLTRRKMRMTIRRQGDNWFARDVQPLPDNIDLGDIDASGLTWDGTRLTGSIDFRWGEQASDDTEVDDEEAEKTQTLDVDLQAAATDRELLLRLHNFQGRNDWVLAYKPKGDTWVFDRQVEAPKQLRGWGPFEIKFPTLKPDTDGNFTAKIQLTYAGDVERHIEAYAKQQPVVTFRGRLVDQRIDTTWLLQAPGGKHFLGSGQDMLTGAVLTTALRGTYRASGASGKWMGDATGAIFPAPSDPVAAIEAEDSTDAPDTPAAAAVRAANVYHEVLALELALRRYPMPLLDALSRVMVPEPAWPDAAKPQAMDDYIAALLRQARRTLEAPARIPVGYVSPDDETFGPYFGLGDVAAEEDNRISPVNDGPQQWQSIHRWKMVGPFSIFDQQIDFNYPEITASPDASFSRARLFTTPEGEVDTVRDHAKWLHARMDRAQVSAPPLRDASAGSERYFTWYAHTQIESEKQQTVWLAMRLEGQAMVWINEQPVWKSGLDYDSLLPAVFQVTLKRGVNDVLVRCASSRASNAHGGRVDWFDGYDPRPMGRIDFTSFAMYVCTRGRPGRTQPPTTAAASPTDRTGYHNNFKGVWPEANPPIAWDLDKGINVAWRVDLPLGMSQPIVRGGRLYLTAEPHWLYCLDAATGKEVWKKQVTHAKAPPLKRDREGNLRPTAQASVSPIVTDSHVYVNMGNGVAACYGLDGRQQWLTPTGATWDHPNMGSPVLVDGRSIIQAHLSKDVGQFALIALDAAGGEKRWTATGPKIRVISQHDRAVGLGNGLAVMRLQAGNTSRSVIITGDGAVIDAADGQMLHRDIFHLEASRQRPVVEGDVVYTTPVMGQEAVKLWIDEAGRVGARTLWRNPPKYGRGQVKADTAFGTRHWMKAPVIRDGLIYQVQVDSAHVPQHYMCPWTQLTIFDAATGKRAVRQRAQLRDATDPTVPPAIAGRYLYVGDGGSPVGGFGGTTTHGQMAVLELQDIPPDDQAWIHSATHNGVVGLATIAAQNRIGQTRCAPVFDGDRMYLRMFDSLACIAVTDAAGSQYQLEQIAATTTGAVIGQRPQPLQIMALTPMAQEPDREKTPVVNVASGRGADDWLVAGPLPVHVKEDMLTSMGGQTGARPREGDRFTYDGKTYTFRRVREDDFRSPGKVDAVAALDGNRNCQGYFYTVLESRRPQKLRYLANPAVDAAWIAGRPLHAGDNVSLDLGHYPMLVRVRFEKLPDFMESPVITPGFTNMPRRDDNIEDWSKRVRAHAPRLQMICRELPRSIYARSARVALTAVGLEAPELPGDTPDKRTDAQPPSQRPTTEARPSTQPPAANANAPMSPDAYASNVATYLLVTAAVVVLLVIVVIVVIILMLRKRGGDPDGLL